jgi:hypothetical protein
MEVVAVRRHGNDLGVGALGRGQAHPQARHAIQMGQVVAAGVAAELVADRATHPRRHRRHYRCQAHR